MADAQAIYAPCCLGVVGLFSGLIYSACIPVKGLMPMAIGSGVGCGVGGLYCLGYFVAEWTYPEIAERRNAALIVIQNRYAEEIGEGKG